MLIEQGNNCRTGTSLIFFHAVCLCAEEVAGLQCVKRILGKVQEMRDQRASLEKQLRDLIQQDDITSTLVTTERADIKVSASKVLL